MIDIRNGELADLWPDETSPEFKSISYALHMAIIRMLEKAAGVGSSCDIDHLAESTLDYMAIEMRSMYYNQTFDLTQKREIIKNTLKWYSRAGTPAAVSEMVSTIFGYGEVIEWYDFENPEERIPGTFDIITDAGFSKDLIARFNKTIKKVKNARSHLRKVNIERKNDATVFIVGRSVLHANISIHDHGIEVTTNV